MSKKPKSGINKSEAIRAYKAANPTAQPKDIAETLGKQTPAVNVSAQFVSTVLSNAKKKGGKIGKRGPKPGSKLGNGKHNAVGHNNLLQFKRAIDAYGGLTEAKKAIAVLEEIGAR
jgi:hypothetical protein